MNDIEVKLPTVEDGTKEEIEDANLGARSERLEKDIDEIRDNLGTLVGELDHRRHEAFNVPLQLRRHGVAVAIAGAVVVVLVAGGIALQRTRRPQYPRLTRRWQDVREGLSLAAGQHRPHPKKPTVGRQIAGAAGAAIVSVVARRFAERMIQRVQRSRKAT